MTVAIAEALIAVGPDATKEEIEDTVIANIQNLGKRYSHAGMVEDFAVGFQNES